MIYPKNFEDLSQLLEESGRQVLFFTADWCGDCQFIYPALPAIEANFPAYRFIRVDRDDFMPLAQEWGIFGIPSLVVVENGREIGRLVNKNRKTQAEIETFLAGL